MPRRKEVLNTWHGLLLDAIVQSYFYDNSMQFEYWTAIAVTDFEMIPDGMASFKISGLLLFYYREAMQMLLRLNIFCYLVTEFRVCFRSSASFEILGDKYINDHPDSEEEICSVKLKKNKLPPEIK
jgi:AraC family transcriptional regulator